MRLLSFIFVLSVPLLAQSPVPDNDYVHQQFGDACSLDPQCNPLIDQDEKNFRVIDPLNSFYGYGDPKITSGFGQVDPRLKGISLLIVHGSGADAWRASQPEAKFVVINIAVKSATLKRMRLRRKKSVIAIYVEEASADQMTAGIFWDGRKYR